MEIKGIRRLLTVAEMGSFSAAAKKLNISQPALTRSIQQLEFAYGAKLIERTADGVRLTQLGRALEGSFNEILNRRENIKAEIKRYQSARKFNSTFGVCISFEALAMPIVLGQIYDHFSTPDMHIHSGLTSKLIDLVASGEIEFALGLQVPGGQIRHPDIQFENVVDDKLVVIGSSTHKLAAQPHVSLETLSENNWILPRLAGFSVPSFEGVFVNYGIKPPQIITLESIVLAKAALKCSNLLTVSSELSIQEDVRRGEVAIINAVAFLPPTFVGLYYRKDAKLSELAQWAMNAIRIGIREASHAITNPARRVG